MVNRYLMALMDIYSCQVLSRNLSNSVDVEWCKEILEEAIELKEMPEFINKMSTPRVRESINL
jgi:hypothetical protein